MNGERDDNNLIGFIATTVETMRDRMETMRDGMVTKTDLAGLATKNDVARLEPIMSGDFEQVHIRLDSIDPQSRIALVSSKRNSAVFVV